MPDPMTAVSTGAEALATPLWCHIARGVLPKEAGRATKASQLTVCPGSQPAPISLLLLLQGQPLLDEIEALKAKLGGSSLQ